MDTMIVIPGHGIAVNPARAREHIAWKGIYAYSEEASLLTEHCSTAVAMTAANPMSILVFTGGDTREAAGPISEAERYRNIAIEKNWWGATDVAPRVLVEGHARDSRDNIVYSLARFYAAKGRFPSRIVVVGWGFKRERFLMHAAAIGWTGEFSYLGVNDPPSGDVLYRAKEGEARKREAMRDDPLLLGVEWSNQRAARNPFRTPEPYSELVPVMAPFLAYLDGRGSAVQAPWSNYKGGGQ